MNVSINECMYVSSRLKAYMKFEQKGGYGAGNQNLEGQLEYACQAAQATIFLPIVSAACTVSLSRQRLIMS